MTVDTTEFVQDTPPTGSDEPMHELSEECWCNPTVLIVEKRVRHNRVAG